MNLRFLSTVIAISRHRSLNAAAQSLGLSHSAVSLQVKSLEDELQFKILDRSKRPPTLTGEGMALVEHAHRIEDAASDIRALADGDRLVGRVIIGAVPSVIKDLMAPVLANLHDKQPDLDIEVASGLSQILIDQVLDGSIHAALVTDPGYAVPNLSIEHICEEPYRLIVASGVADTDPIRLLQSQPFIWFDRRSRLTRDVEAMLKQAGVTVRSTMEVNSFEGVAALVRHNLGVSILPKQALSADPQGIQTIPLGKKGACRFVVVASRENSPRKNLVHLLATELRALFK
ncbi:MAG: LysR family transcriptional regulator [Rhodobacteraceae bacterium]|nr:LysR family transcriptional regulator [Paracoccaceae bacterium]